jgi:hypothetical protein
VYLGLLLFPLCYSEWYYNILENLIQQGFMPYTAHILLSYLGNSYCSYILNKVLLLPILLCEN